MSKGKISVVLAIVLALIVAVALLIVPREQVDASRGFPSKQPFHIVQQEVCDYLYPGSTHQIIPNFGATGNVCEGGEAYPAGGHILALPDYNDFCDYKANRYTADYTDPFNEDSWYCYPKAKK